MPRINTKKFYTASLKRYAQTAKGVQWHSQESQEIRFKVILQMLPKDLYNYTLVDAGCGFGDFYNYLQKHHIKVNNYIGIDCLDFMCKIARKTTNQEIVYADITKESSLPIGDFYICSGAMNTLTKFESYQFIHNCYQHAKKGFIFNALYANKHSITYNYFTNTDIQQLLTHLHVKYMKTQNDYLEEDITILFLR
jgi:SAM-dependent methyltransferase